VLAFVNRIRAVHDNRRYFVSICGIYKRKLIPRPWYILRVYHPAVNLKSRSTFLLLRSTTSVVNDMMFILFLFNFFGLSLRACLSMIYRKRNKILIRRYTRQPQTTAISIVMIYDFENESIVTPYYIIPRLPQYNQSNFNCSRTHDVCRRNNVTQGMYRRQLL